jgi:glycosyltransferase involved in cell wall biosynthesis
VRLAFLSPLPPAATGIADYAAVVLGYLVSRHEIDVFHAQDEVDRSRIPDACSLNAASTFPERHRERPYDLTVYQMGNGPAHDFVYEHLSRVPGLLVLHDLVLHHSRAAHFLEAEPVRAWRRDPGSAAACHAARPWLDAWREELTYTYGKRGERLFQAQIGTVGDLLPYAYPLLRIPLEASRLVAVHNSFMARAVLEEAPGIDALRVPQPVSREPVEPAAVSALRKRLGLAEGHVVVGVFGLLTPEKRVETVARAVARVAAWNPQVRLLLAGPVPDLPRLERLVERVGVAPLTTITGRVPLDQLPAHIEAADIVVQLRYPTARETSGALLRVLAQGRPTVISDLAHQDEFPDDIVVRADVAEEEGAVTRALLGLAANPAARHALGKRAAVWIETEYAPERTRDAWERALEEARRRPDPPARDWPAHWPRPQVGTGSG